jgi:hypothetical protein
VTRPVARVECPHLRLRESKRCIFRSLFIRAKQDETILRKNPLETALATDAVNDRRLRATKVAAVTFS